MVLLHAHVRADVGGAIADLRGADGVAVEREDALALGLVEAGPDVDGGGEVAARVPGLAGIGALDASRREGRAALAELSDGVLAEDDVGPEVVEVVAGMGWTHHEEEEQEKRKSLFHAPWKVRRSGPNPNDAA